VKGQKLVHRHRFKIMRLHFLNPDDMSSSKAASIRGPILGDSRPFQWSKKAKTEWAGFALVRLWHHGATSNRLPGRRFGASFWDAMDDPELAARRQSRAAGQHAKPRSKQGVRLLRQSGLSSQRRTGGQPFSGWRDLQQPTATHGLHSTRLSRR
jgi:hypothetical protein